MKVNPATQVEVLQVAKDPKTNPHPLAPTVANMDQMPSPPRTAQVQRGKSIPKKGPTGVSDTWPTARPRQIQERMGARRRIEVKLPGPQSPEAGATQANGRVVRPVMGQRGNFWDQAGQRW